MAHHGESRIDHVWNGDPCNDVNFPMLIDTPEWVKDGSADSSGRADAVSINESPRYVSVCATKYSGAPGDRSLGHQGALVCLDKVNPTSACMDVSAGGLVSAWNDVSAARWATIGAQPAMSFKPNRNTDCTDPVHWVPSFADIPCPSFAALVNNHEVLPPVDVPYPSFLVRGTSQTHVPAGSRGHATGECKPCAHFWKPAGCSKGDDCERCHLCDQHAFKAYREGYKAALRAQRQPRRRQLGGE